MPASIHQTNLFEKSMKYIIVDKYGPGIEGWESYAEWAGLQHCTEYYSINNGSLFEPVTKEDWENCINKGL